MSSKFWGAIIHVEIGIIFMLTTLYLFFSENLILGCLGGAIIGCCIAEFYFNKIFNPMNALLQKAHLCKNIQFLKTKTEKTQTFKETKKMNTWFTSDTHFGHANIIKYCKRPFKNLEQMEEVIIRNWNERVKPDDLVIFLGDFCFKGGTRRTLYNADYYRKKLNGNIVFIKGNHDGNNSLNTRLKSIIYEFGSDSIYCVHRPENFSQNYSLNLVGHVHEKWKIKQACCDDGNKILMVNVGVDQWGFKPIKMEEIYKAIQKFKKETKKKN